MKIPLEYNARSLLQRPVSTLLTALGIALVVAVFIGMLALANGFAAALTRTGSDRNVLVLRKGADSEMSSALDRAEVSALTGWPHIARDAEGRPLASPEVYVVIPLGRGAVLGSLPLFAVGFVYAAMEFTAPACGGSRFTAGLNAVEWAMVGAAMLMVLAGVLATRSPRPALEESPAVRWQAPPWLVIVAAAVVLCGFVWLLFSYFGLG